MKSHLSTIRLALLASALALPFILTGCNQNSGTPTDTTTAPSTNAPDTNTPPATTNAPAGT